MTVEAGRWRETNAYTPSDRDDKVAELIASLTPEDADRLWSVIIQLKPHLRD